jgi:benzoyl-CoA reductase/2-hydroxyglutaryl-CoA dehydratase subunit BcrC/BadD/HgdB
MLLQYFEGTVNGIEAKLQADPDSPNPRKKYALEIAKLGRRLYSDSDRVAWTGIVAPFELLSTMGVTSCFVEFVGAMMSATGGVGPILEEAEHAGYAADTCGYHRAVLGAAMKGLVPVPDFMIATTCPCTGGLAVLENLAEVFERDLFVLQVPQDNSDEGVRFLAGQIEKMVEFVTSHTGEPMDKDKMRLAIERSNEASEYIAQAYRLCKEVPSPTSAKDLQNFGIVMPLFFGSDEAGEIARAYRDEFTARIESGSSGVPRERLRLMWIQNRIQFKHPLIEMLEKEYQAAVVVDELNDITWEPIDPDDPYPGLARRAISIPFNGPVDRRVAHLKKLAQEYQIDGAINPCHWGCRQGTGGRGMIQEGLREIGVPVLNLEVDCVDSRNFSEGQLRTRLEAFLEMLEGRKTALH